MCSSSGSTCRKVSSGPEATRVSMPARTTLPLPLTGAARKATPRSAHAARIASEALWSTVEQSTTILGTSSGSASSPPSPTSTCSRSLLVDTIVKTASSPRSSAMLSATMQPRSASGSAFARVRFQTVTFTPARASRAAMAAPMRPAPIQPTEPTWPGVSWWFMRSSSRDRAGRRAGRAGIRPAVRRASRRCTGGARGRRSRSRGCRPRASAARPDHRRCRAAARRAARG